jgi:hypothetical protein
LWEAPALNCERLYLRLENFDEQGAMLQYSEQVATVLMPGDPPDALFSLPSDAADVPPSELAPRVTGGDRLDTEIEEKTKQYHDPRHRP